MSQVEVGAHGHSFGGPRERRNEKGKEELCFGCSYLVKVDFYAPNIGGANWNHPEEPVFPSPEERHSFV
jgi:hypothetical protein